MLYLVDLNLVSMVAIIQNMLGKLFQRKGVFFGNVLHVLFEPQIVPLHTSLLVENTASKVLMFGLQHLLNTPTKYLHMSVWGN